MTTPTLADVVAAIEHLYPPTFAEDWDAVGLVAGDLSSEVHSVLFAVDPVQAVIDEAIASNVDLIVVHHPLLLRPVSSVAADTPKGRVVHELITNGTALYVAHTNADITTSGVSESLAYALGLDDLRPIVPVPSEPLDTVVRGAGRFGTLPQPMTLRDFADAVAAAIPPTVVGARVSGDLDREVRVVAVAGGAGDSLLPDVRASEADVYVTSDLRHHPASEFREQPGAPALIDIPHWAAEWTWLPVVSDALDALLAERGLTVKSEVSRICTDPWNYRAAGATTPS